MDNEGIRYSRCKRCNRILKTELAQKRGYGDYCWKIHNNSVNKSKNRFLLTKYIFSKE